MAAIGFEGFETGYFNVGHQRMIFDGKRQRKPVEKRKTIDLGSPSIYYNEQRPFAPGQWGGGWGGSSTYSSGVRGVCSGWGQGSGVYGGQRSMLPPVAWERSPATSIHTKWIHTSANKNLYPINCAIFTPEGRRVITGSSSGEFTLWSGITFNFETLLQAHDAAIRSMVWAHNENWMISGDDSGVIKYWQTSMNWPKEIRAHLEAIRALTFSPSDQKFASCSDDTKIKIFDFATGTEERVLSGHGWDVKSVDWHPQKAVLATGSKDNLIKLWDPRSSETIATIHSHKNSVMQVGWNDNGNWLLSCARDQLLKLYDFRTLRELKSFRGHAKEVTTFTWHPVHEDLFVSGSADGSIMFWRVNGDDTNIGEIKSAHGEFGTGESVWSLQFHPVGHILVSGGNDKKTKFWSRNRPGDALSDKYNTGIPPIPKAVQQMAAGNQVPHIGQIPQNISM